MSDRPREALCDLPLLEVAARLCAGELSPVAVTERVLERIAAREATLNAFVTVREEEARREARQAEREITAGEYR